MSRRIAFFDLDDTLCDREAAFGRWAQQFCAEHGLEESTALPVLHEYDQHGLRPREAFFALVADRLGLSDAVVDLVAAYSPAYVKHYRLEPAVAEGLRGLRADGWTVGVVTNGVRWQLDKLRLTGLDTIVDGWVVSGLEGVAKPYPELFRRAATACGGTLADAVWMVGDNPIADIGGAVLSGLRSIWIELDHHGGWAEPAFKPDVTCDGPLAAIQTIGND